MKTPLLALILMTSAAFAQTAPPAQPAKAKPTYDELVRENSLLKLRVAVAQAQVANANADIAQHQVDSMRSSAQTQITSVQTSIEATRKQLKYGDDYAWDYQLGDFVKKPAAPSQK